MRLFVYGTLLGDSETAAACWLRVRMRGAIRASVPGRLVAIPTDDGWFPALVRGRANDRVWGTVCELALGRGDLPRLDAYEGREYRREAARALVAGTGERVTVRLYRWRVSLPAGARPIPRGDFLSWLCTSGTRAYASSDGAGSSLRDDRPAIHAALTDPRIAAGPGSLRRRRSTGGQRGQGQ